MEDDGFAAYRPPSGPTAVEIPALCSEANEPFAIRMEPRRGGGWDMVSARVGPTGSPSSGASLEDFEGPFCFGPKFARCPVCGSRKQPFILVCRCGQVFCSHRARLRWFGPPTATCPRCGFTDTYGLAIQSVGGRESQ